MNIPLDSVLTSLVDASIKSILVIAMAGGLMLALQRASAAMRHSIWFAAIAALLFLPIFSFVVPAWQKPLWVVSADVSPANEVSVSIELAGNRASSSVVDQNKAIGKKRLEQNRTAPTLLATGVSSKWFRILPAVWLFGTAVTLGYLAIGIVRLRGLRRQAKPFPGNGTVLAELCRQFSIRRGVLVLQSENQVMPVTWGWRRPIILLPAGADQWSPERQRIVLQHELAHVKRWDCLSYFITRIVCSFYWFNPLVWLAARRICVERERACDDLVLLGGYKASDYASHLVEIARSFRRVPKVAAIAMARPSQLEGRVRAIVDASRARRAPRAFALSLLWAVMLGFVATIAAQKVETAEVKVLRDRQIAQLKAFSVAKEKQSKTLAAKVNQKISPEYRTFFDAATTGNGQVITNMFESFKRRHPQYQHQNKEATDHPDMSLAVNYWSPVLEISMAYYDVLAGEPKYIQKAADGIINSIPKGSIYFGGTDPGRALPTAFCKSHVDGDPFFILTQNALADDSYLTYLIDTYGGKIYTPTKQDSEKAFKEYTSDAGKRLEHDTKFPNEPRQVRPGEDIRVVDGKVNVVGQVAVMAINGLLTKVIFDRNPQHEFYIEESFPLDWMYPHLEPHGLIMKLNREPVETLSEETIQKDHDYWRARVDEMIGPWLREDTSVQTIAEFVQKVYVSRNLAGFTGDARFVQNENAQKMFSKWRASIGGLYSWHIPGAKSPNQQKRVIKEADFAFRQAYALCPSSPEALYRYINLLISLNRVDDSIRLAEATVALAPENGQNQNLLKELHRIRSTQPPPK
jgi:beta-lactamase regulating signal transducer with metallopeptidase domain